MQPRSRVPWALALAVGLSAGLAGYVIHAAITRRAPKQVVTVRRLTDMPGAEETPAISPDGKMVAFVAEAGGHRQIWIREVTDGAPTPITHDDADHSGPRWYPNSRSLIYFAAGAIWQIDASGGDARRVRDAAGPGDVSHDGGRLALAGSENLDVCQGSNCAAVSSGHDYSNVRWSPDDKKIAYLHDQTVWVIASTGGASVKAADLSVQGFTWAPDNSGLIASVHGELWFIPRVEGRQPSQLTFGELSYESPDVNRSGTVVVSRRGLAAQDADIVLFSGLKW